jgi:hypothetical protein
MDCKMRFAHTCGITLRKLINLSVLRFWMCEEGNDTYFLEFLGGINVTIIAKFPVQSWKHDRL